jgi:hypothetical protein
MQENEVADGAVAENKNSGLRPIEPQTAYFLEEKNDIDELMKYFFPERISNRPNIEVHAGESEVQTFPGDEYGTNTPPVDHLGYENSQEEFRAILDAIWKNAGSFTVVVERFHVDPSYRDRYYNYFAGQHFQVSRFTERLTFFTNDHADESAFSPSNADALNRDFIGTCIIFPTEAKTLGRILLKPEYIFDADAVYHVRLTEYTITVFGIRLTFRAFPCQMQDRETTRCAEVTLLNILNYFGSTYSEYRAYLPSDIVNMEQEFNSDRTLPSRGINYSTMSKLLMRCGFSPRLYSVRALRREDGKRGDMAWKRQEMRRLLHYYVESGIPVAVNVAHEKKHKEPGHSLICIGYKRTPALDTNSLPYERITDGPLLYNAADYYQEYVVMDDNQRPYSVRNYEDLSIHPYYKVENILVPLYKRMYLEASDAYDVVRYILQHENLGIVSRYPRFPKNESLVVRLFLASSRTYKKFRIENSDAQLEQDRAGYRALYGEIPLPRFVWVAELFTKNDYEAQGNAFGEIVLDATAATKNDAKSIIMLNYPDSIAVRWPASSIEDLNKGYKGSSLSPFPRFTGNLQKIGEYSTI